MTAITLRRTEQQDIALFAQAIAGSGYFNVNQAQAAIAIVAGREIGIGPVEALRSFHFTRNGVQPSAALLARLVRRHPRYDYTVNQLDDSACELLFWMDGEEAGVSRYTLEDAKRAGLAGGESWKKYPANMCFARCMTNGVSWYAPDVIDALTPDPSALPFAAAADDPEGPPAVPMDAGGPETPTTQVSTPGPVDVGSPIALGEGAGRDSATVGEGQYPEPDPTAADGTYLDNVDVEVPADDGTDVPEATEDAAAPPASPSPEAHEPDEALPSSDGGAAAIPPGYKDALWADLESRCIEAGKSRLGHVARTLGRTVQLRDGADAFTAEELERCLAALDQAASA